MTSALHEQDVVFASPVVQDAIDGLQDEAAPKCGSENLYVQHRAAAQQRTGRLRTIEALRKPRK